MSSYIIGHEHAVYTGHLILTPKVNYCTYQVTDTFLSWQIYTFTIASGRSKQNCTCAHTNTQHTQLHTHIPTHTCMETSLITTPSLHYSLMQPNTMRARGWRAGL